MTQSLWVLVTPPAWTPQHSQPMAQTPRCELTPNAPLISTPLQGEHVQGI